MFSNTISRGRTGRSNGVAHGSYYNIFTEFLPPLGATSNQIRWSAWRSVDCRENEGVSVTVLNSWNCESNWCREGSFEGGGVELVGQWWSV
ncbi:hypothetical protein AVEN_19746-1 [Araneus ventricosus]|uniref:Uncharacterized protein n=1 Tax=Araneus ventricosus TaxID=182803 RepID=A0A4Y2MK88_ARAVE|nr:hypothetical protein AVEN_19746-1 [Araneus ventricosus]